jgi:hypothetical protein
MFFGYFLFVASLWFIFRAILFLSLEIPYVGVTNYLYSLLLFMTRGKEEKDSYLHRIRRNVVGQKYLAIGLLFIGIFGLTISFFMILNAK